MSFFEILTHPLQMFRQHTLSICAILFVLICATIYPTDLKNDYPISKEGHNQALIEGTEKYGRHINTLLPLGTAVFLRDWNGLKQIAVITVAGIFASHGPKRLLNDITVQGTRLGERPRSPDSRHNMPSGHSTLASAGAYFMIRRYNVWFSLIVIPITLLTMYARVMLDAHTISATIAGAMTGLLITALFASKRKTTS